MQLKTVIIEDEELVAQNLEKALRSIDGDIEVLACLSSLHQARQWFSQHPAPDLIFMDIQLSDGVSFDLLNDTRIDCPIIFTTAYNEYALRAFKVNSIDYLLKPVDTDELKLAIEKFRKYRYNNIELNYQPRLDELLRSMNKGQEHHYKERFMVQSRNAIMPVSHNQVGYFVKNELVYLYTSENQKLIADYGTMDELEQLVNPRVFFRANRQYIIHINAVESYRSGVNSKLTVKLKAPLHIEIDISREKAHAFKEWLAGD